jgi:hypothetical protein
LLPGYECNRAFSVTPQVKQLDNIGTQGHASEDGRGEADCQHATVRFLGEAKYYLKESS